MKNITTLLFIFTAVFVCACSKSNVGDNTLTGKWRLSETAYGIGTGPVWTPVADKGKNYIIFNSDGTLGGNYYVSYVKYAVKDSVTLTFYTATNAQQGYRYSFQNNVLELSPSPTFCTEGCSERFTR